MLRCTGRNGKADRTPRCFHLLRKASSPIISVFAAILTPTHGGTVRVIIARFRGHRGGASVTVGLCCCHRRFRWSYWCVEGGMKGERCDEGTRRGRKCDEGGELKKNKIPLFSFAAAVPDPLHLQSTSAMSTTICA